MKKASYFVLLFLLFIFHSEYVFSQDWSDKLIEGEQQMQRMELNEAIASFEIVEKGIEYDTTASNAYIMCLLLKASCYFQLGKINESEINAQKADSIALNIYGGNSEAHYSALRVLSSLYYYHGRKEDAAKYTLMLLEVGENVMGKYNQQHLQDLITNATCLIEIGKSDYTKNIIDDIFNNHNSLIDTLPEINLGLHSVLAKIYKYKKDQIMQIKEYKFLIEHSDFTKSSFQLSTYGLEALTNLANIYAGEGNEAKAIILLENYLPIFSNFKTKTDVLKLTAIYDQLGDLYRGMELPQKSKEYYSSSLKVIEETYGKDNQFYFDEINSIAELYTELNLYKEADSLYSMELVWSNKNDSSIKSQVNCLTNLAFNKIQWGHYLEARKICLGVLAKYELINEKNNYQKRQILQCIYYVGLTFKNENNYIEAEKYYKEAIDYIDKNRKSFDDFTYIQQIKGLEYLYSTFGKYKEAEKCYDLILDSKYKNAYQNQKRYELEYNFEAAILADQLGENNKFLTLIANFTSIQNEVIDSNLSGLPVAQQLDYITLFKRYCAILLSIIYNNDAEPKLIDACYNNFLNTQDLTYKSQRDNHTSINGSKKQPTNNPNTVRNRLHSGEAVIEFISFRYFSNSRNQWTDSIFYVAIISIAKNSTPEYIFITSNKTIDSLNYPIKNLPYNQYFTTLYLDSNISKTILKPIEKKLNGINTVYIVESGTMHELNLAALQVDTNKTFGEKYNLHILSTTNDLIDYKPTYLNTSTIKQAIVYGGIDYDKASNNFIKTEDSTDNQIGYEQVSTLASRSATAKFGDLPGTLTEAKNIQQISSKKGITTAVYSGENATEASIKKLSGNKEPYILHIATHGYFFPDPEIKKQENAIQQFNDQDKRNVFKWSDEPLLRSGLIFAGANKAWGNPDYVSNDSTEDGILTSYEISNLDLSNCQLVVLSACETGLGDIKGSEGVFGLQRAFKMAGVKNIIMSLWKVPDTQTSELMTLFYNYCFAGKSVHDALQAAQTEMKKKYPPYYWAGFKLLE